MTQFTNILEVLSDNYKNKCILVTGATGMIGQNVVDLLLSMNDIFLTNIYIIAHCRNYTKAELIFKDVMDRKDIDFLTCDIKDLYTDKHVDFIVHTASITGGSKQHLDYPMRTISTALEGAKRVLDLALRDKAATVFLSSLEVYGFTGECLEEISENDGGYIDCTDPRSSYSESKRMCECMFSAYAKQYGVETFIARLTATFGAGVSNKDKRVFAQFAHNIIEGRDIVLKSTGKTVRNYCDAADAATALLTILVNGISGEAYNVANMETEISIKDMAQRFIDLYPSGGSNLTFDLNEDAVSLGYNREMRCVLNSTKLLDIGWRPVYNMDDMIRHLVESMKKTNKKLIYGKEVL